MALQTNLNKKDKMTIAILLFAAGIFMIIWFLIKPAISSIMTTSDKIELAELKQQQYKSKIMLLTSAEAVYDKAVDDLNESTADYYEIMDSSQIDRKVTSYILKSGLFAENLVIKMPSGSVEEKSYLYSDVSNGTNSSSADTVTDTSTTENTNAESLTIPYNNARNNNHSTESSGVQCVELTLVVTGSHSVCQAFIDDICTKKAIRVTGFTWSKVDMIEVYNEETGVFEKEDPGIERLRIDINLYMADIADYSTAVTEPAA